MSNFEEYDVYDKKDFLTDILLTILVGAGMYLYWAFSLFVLSIILLNIWHVSWQQMLIYAAVPAAVSWVVYIIKLFRKRRAKQ